MKFNIIKSNRKAITKDRFCCDRFKYRFQSPINVGLNIRIVKLSGSDVFNKSELKRPYRFFMTSGHMKKENRIARIDYCPFCGKHLIDFYNSDVYVNEKTSNFII